MAGQSTVSNTFTTDVFDNFVFSFHNNDNTGGVFPPGDHTHILFQDKIVDQSSGELFGLDTLFNNEHTFNTVAHFFPVDGHTSETVHVNNHVSDFFV
jgi:hypothetical protein